MSKEANILSTEFDEPKANGLTIENDKSAKVENYDAGERVENDKNKKDDSNKMNFKKNCLLSGAFGGVVTLSIVVLVAFIIPGFRYSSYYVNKDPSLLTQLLSTNLSEQDSLYLTKVIVEETDRRKDLIVDMLEQGIIVSSEDFASNLSGSILR